MGLFKRGSRPERLAMRGDVDGLKRLLERVDRVETPDGEVVDLAIPRRVEAVQGLAQIHSPAALYGLIFALDDPAPEVRAVALRGLGKRAEPPAIEAIVAVIGTPRDPRDELGRSIAVQVLLERTDDVSAALVSHLLERDEAVTFDVELRVALGTLLERARTNGGARAVAELATVHLASTHEQRRRRAEEVLTLLGADFVDLVIGVLDDPSARVGAAHVLGALRDSRATEDLILHLDDQTPAVRAAAARALGEIRHPDAMEALMIATRDDHYDVRAAASGALDRFGAMGVAVGTAALLGPYVRQLAERPDASTAQRPALERIFRRVTDANEPHNREAG